MRSGRVFAADAMTGRDTATEEGRALWRAAEGVVAGVRAAAHAATVTMNSVATTHAAQRSGAGRWPHPADDLPALPAGLGRRDLSTRIVS
jgi:hypothetical protein